jgi:hypothetical protein
MKQILIILAALGLLAVGCVDDYQDANPESGLDSPWFYLSTQVDTINQQGTITVAVGVVDAPGKIDAVTATLSDEDAGTVAVEGFDAVKGSETGTFNLVYTPAASGFEGDVTMTVTVTDAQGEDLQKTHQDAIDLFVIYVCDGVDLAGDYAGQVTTTAGGLQAEGSATLTADGDSYKLADLTLGFGTSNWDTLGIEIKIPIILTCQGETYSYTPDASAIDPAFTISGDSVIIDGPDEINGDIYFFPVSVVPTRLLPDGSLQINWRTNSDSTGNQTRVTILTP